MQQIKITTRIPGGERVVGIIVEDETGHFVVGINDDEIGRTRTLHLALMDFGSALLDRIRTAKRALIGGEGENGE
jgi:hypothetical protein